MLTFEQKVMKLMYIGEVAFNINGMAIHLGLVILLEKKNQ